MKHTIIQAATAALLLGLLPAAHAVPTLSISVDGGAAITCADGAGCDASPEAGWVSLSQSFGGFSITAMNGLSKPLLTDGYPAMDLSTLVQVSGGVHTLVIKFSDTDFDLYGGRLGMAYGGTLLGTGASFEHSAYYDAGNVLFAQGTLIGQTGTVAAGAFSGTIGDGWSPMAPYSVTEILTLNTAGKTTFSGDFAVNVPEPATLALLGIGLIGFAAVRRRRQSS